MANDKKTIGVTAENAKRLAALVASGHFASELDAAKFAMATAIRRGISAGNTEGAETKWNVGSVDPDGLMRAMVESLCPDSMEPYRLIEHLINEGVQALVSNKLVVVDIYAAMLSDSAT